MEVSTAIQNGLQVKQHPQQQQQQPQEDSLSESLVPSSELSSASNLSSSGEDEDGSLDSTLHQIEANFSEDNVPYFVKSLHEELNCALNYHSDRSMNHTELLIPSGKECGRSLIIDLGGSTLKVCIIDLLGESKYEILARKTWEIPNDKKVISLNFFKMMADRVEEVLKTGQYFARGERISTGISWSFPFEQKKPNDGYIYVVSKGYSLADDTKGHNLAELFSNAMRNEKGIEVEVNSIINDAVSVYVSGLYVHACKLGLVLGTGLNASFAVGNSVINSELSFFGSSCATSLANNAIDRGICADYVAIPEDNYLHSEYLVYQPLEYICAGRYLGEMFRLGIELGTTHGELFENQLSRFAQCKDLTTPYQLQSDIVSKMSECSYKEAKELFMKGYGLDLSKQDFQKIVRLVEVLTNRAATVMASALMACVKFIDEHSTVPVEDKYCRLGFVGSLLKYYTGYKEMVDAVLDRYHVQMGLPVFDLRHIDDSSILGAAVAARAFVASQQ
ncbi:DEKNAAC104805 [Brettanomyces naardenensis]|uniref:Phosphotransferase n=1 Tax=Brettanomyces naardenensis TaxID=13370 RepID=A0A448YS95_BRENA|nr:DEKNAAC104805 [Brettanomyces naardenensis]